MQKFTTFLMFAGQAEAAMNLSDKFGVSWQLSLESAPPSVNDVLDGK